MEWSLYARLSMFEKGQMKVLQYITSLIFILQLCFI